MVERMRTRRASVRSWLSGLAASLEQPLMCDCTDTCDGVECSSLSGSAEQNPSNV
jgi:hypothetical protein